MAPMKGTFMPKKGTVVHPSDTNVHPRGTNVHRSGGGAGGDGSDDYAAAIAGALQQELGNSGQAIKSVMRWTGASARTAKHWFTGRRGPSGPNLLALARHSDYVFDAFLERSGRAGEMIGGLSIDASARRGQAVGVAADGCRFGPGGAGRPAGVIEMELPSGVRLRMTGIVERAALRNVLAALEGAEESSSTQ